MCRSGGLRLRVDFSRRSKAVRGAESPMEEEESGSESEGGEEGGLAEVEEEGFLTLAIRLSRVLRRLVVEGSFGGRDLGLVDFEVVSLLFFDFFGFCSGLVTLMAG